MARQRKSKAERIRSMLAQKKSVKTIAKSVDCTPQYVGQVRWQANKKAA